MKDDVQQYNYRRWQALASVDAVYTTPVLDLDVNSAASYLQLERLGISEELQGKKVLCLASGGGQQSVAFREVFREVAPILKHGGIYYLMCANPFVTGMTEHDWQRTGYTRNTPYVDGTKIIYPDQEWVYDRTKHETIQPPQEFLQTLSIIINSLIALGFSLKYFAEIKSESSPHAEPGSWEHFTHVSPPWLEFVWVK